MSFHVCSICKTGLAMNEDVFDCTHLDCNSCPVIFEIMYGEQCETPLCPTDSCNDRDYPCGLKTRDNGGGYDIIECPFCIVDYVGYLRTEVWKENREKRLRHDGYRCAFCGTAKNLQVHHITYENLGHEKMEDMLTLCRGCHERLHSKDIKKGATNEKTLFKSSYQRT